MLLRCAGRLFLSPSTAIRLKTVGSRAGFVFLAGSATSAPFLYRGGVSLWRTCHCDAPASHVEQHILPSPVAIVKETSAALAATSRLQWGLGARIYWTIRLFLRATRLWLTFAPLIVLYPVLMWTSTTRHAWWALAVTAMQYGGPTLVKFAQWASTRRDLFSKEFCDHMAVLQRHTGPRPWRHYESVLNETFGKGVWKQLFSNLDHHPVGSGCIANVNIYDPLVHFYGSIAIFCRFSKLRSTPLPSLV